MCEIKIWQAIVFCEGIEKNDWLFSIVQLRHILHMELHEKFNGNTGTAGAGLQKTTKDTGVT